MSDEKRDHVHQLWNSVAPHWGEHADYIDAKGEGLNKVLLDNAAISATDRVLELACGAGGLGLAAAGRAGKIVISDVSEAMVAIAAARVAARGVTNAHTAVRDIEEIDEPDASFDAVVCREGLMFAVEPANAFAVVRRVLKTGGRLSAAVWGPKERNPWLGLVIDGVSAQLGRSVPPPGMPGPFALSDASQLRALCDAAGLREIVIDDVEVPSLNASFDEWWARTSALAGPLANVLATLPDDAKHELVSRLHTAVAPYEQTDGTLVFPGESLVVRAVA